MANGNGDGNSGPTRLSAVVDTMLLYLFLVAGVALSGQVLANSGSEEPFTLQPVSLPQLLGSAVIAAIYIGRTDLGELQGKLRFAAKVRRYSASLSNGVTFRLLAEAGTG